MNPARIGQAFHATKASPIEPALLEEKVSTVWSFWTISWNRQHLPIYNTAGENTHFSLTPSLDLQVTVFIAASSRALYDHVRSMLFKYQFPPP